MELLEIGLLLQARREELQLTINDVNEVTKIKPHYLEAIEAGDESVLPATVYTQGFIRSYASYLGLDGRELAAAYGRYRQAQGDESGFKLGEVPDVASPRARRRLGRGGWQAAAGANARGPDAAGGQRGIGSIILGVLVITALILGTAYALKSARGDLDGPLTGWLQTKPDPAEGAQGENFEPPGGNGQTGPALSESGGDEGQPDDGSADGDEDEQGLLAPPAVEVVAEPNTREILYLVTAPAELELTITADSRSWAEVWVDDEKVLSGFFEVGQAYDYKAEKMIRVWAGNPPGLIVTVNGVELGSPEASSPRDLIVKPADDLQSAIYNNTGLAAIR